MPVTIGGKSLATSRPADLDAKLIDACGCNAAEARNWLASGTDPGHVALALHPFLGDDAPTVQELAAMIAGEHLTEVAVQVRKLYDDPATVQPPAPPTADA